MALTLEALKTKRKVIKTQVTRFETLINKINEETDLQSLDLEGRLSRHNELWQAFDEVQTRIEELLPTDDDSIYELERVEFEDRFYKISGNAKKYIKKLSLLSTMSSAQSTSNNQFNFNQDSIQNTCAMNQNPGQSPSQVSSYFQLPKLKTSTFHGTFDTWLEFYDPFKAMCHDNEDIPTINKFMYLKACVQGDARKVIDSLETTAANYAIAWDLLRKRYDNRRVIVESHINALFEIPTVSKEFPVRMLLDNIQKRNRALKALVQPVHQWDSLLIFIVKEKLNNYIREKWDERIGTSNIPTMNDMTTFLEERALFEVTQSSQKSVQSHKNASKNGIHSRSNPKQSQSCMAATISKDATIKSNNKCLLCSEEHLLYYCKQFLNMSTQERYDVVKKASICHNCFNPNYNTRDCRKGSCRICKKRHNSLLHFNSKTREQDVSDSPNSSTTLASFHAQLPSQVILGTALLEILDNKGQYHICCALLDSCSQCNSITDKFASALGLKKKRLDIQLKGVDNLKTNVKYTTSTKIKSRVSDLNLNMSFLVFNEISSRMPSVALDRKLFRIPDNISLADPEFHRPADVDILISAEFYYDLLGAGKIRPPGQSAVLQQTDLGWIVAGRYTQPRVSPIGPMQASCNLIKFQDLPILWELEPENPSKVRSREEKACESHYVENTIRDDTNRYVVKLPFNDKKESLGDSRNTAFQRFYALERKFEKNPTFKAQYSECI